MIEQPATLPEKFSRLSAWLQQELAATALTIIHCEALGGGAIQENWALDVIVQTPATVTRQTQRWVLRTDSAATLSTSHTRAEEFAILQIMAGIDIASPLPILLCEDTAIIGTPFYLMARASGVAQARKITRSKQLSQFGESLAQSLGQQLALIHGIKPADDLLDNDKLGFLELPERNPASARIDRYRLDLDRLSTRSPVLEYGLNWLQDNQPDTYAVCLCHCDYRTGNYLVDGGQLTAILDWEFANWSDPHEDLGWFTARCWRFGNDHLEAGGIASLDVFLEGYESVTGSKADRKAVRYWQVMAEVRWAVIAMQQAERHFSGQEVSLELALTERMVPEMEFYMLTAIKEFSDIEREANKQDVGYAVLDSVSLQPAKDKMQNNPVAASELSKQNTGNLSAAAQRQSSLLDAALAEFDLHVLPHVQGQQRFSAAMLKRTLQILQRELKTGLDVADTQLLRSVQSPGSSQCMETLADHIRDRKIAADAELHSALLAHCQQRLVINNPALLEGTVESNRKPM